MNKLTTKYHVAQNSGRKNFDESVIFNFWRGKHWRMLDPVIYWVGEKFGKSYTIYSKSFTGEKFCRSIGNHETSSEIQE